MGDPYYSVLKKVESAILQLNRDVEDRNSSFQGLLFKKDTTIRNQIKNVQGLIDGLLAQVKSNESENPYNLNDRELGKRRKIAFDFQNQFQAIQAKFANFNLRNRGDDYENPENFPGQRRDFEGMGADEQKIMRKRLLDEQDELFDGIGDAVGQIRKGQMTMADELRYQNGELLPGIIKDVEKNQDKVNKSNNRLLQLLKSKSNWFLYKIIAAQVGFFVVMILL